MNTIINSVNYKNYIINIFYIILFTASFSTGCAGVSGKESGIADALKNFSGDTVVPREANSISILQFKNLTAVENTSEKLYIRLKEEIIRDGRLSIVPEDANPDIQLEGILLDYQIQPVKFGNTGQIIIKRLRITASVRLLDLQKNREIFIERGIQAFKEFSEVEPPVFTESRASDMVLEELAKRIALKTAEGWYTKLMTPVEKGKE